MEHIIGTDCEDERNHTLLYSQVGTTHCIHVFKIKLLNLSYLYRETGFATWSQVRVEVRPFFSGKCPLVFQVVVRLTGG